MQKEAGCIENFPARIVGTTVERATAGTIRIKRWNRRERMGRALLFGGGVGAIALPSILIPILHFILVPGFILGGLSVGIWVFGIENEIAGGEGTCPKCDAHLPIARSRARFPLNDLCTRCWQNVRIEIENRTI